ncbi:MAG TPA: carbohydrate ABC transporter substrate-binding protein, partial [Pelagibacterales bacterium]|nr:carbohydrate ABC transporter substrate-binding protein [Pelagibacterales bacterium]
MKNKFLILMTSLIIAMFGSSSARSESITLGWAAWDPANALVELSKSFTAETGIEMNFEFVPWPNFPR